MNVSCAAKRGKIVLRKKKKRFTKMHQQKRDKQAIVMQTYSEILSTQKGF